MSLEIEIEFLVPNLTTIETLLKKINAELKEKTIYRDIYFNKKEFYNNNRIRLRKIERTYPSKNSSSLFTKKSPKIENGIQISEEKETQPKSFDWAYTKLETKYGSP
ncbi:MAG: hypothetical protein KAT91_03920 [Candidatus Aenigmarchaeota archaeon]|nr:hypothetical protein [Candidatus Aenigmarchaeota archaeon]